MTSSVDSLVTPTTPAASSRMSLKSALLALAILSALVAVALGGWYAASTLNAINEASATAASQIDAQAAAIGAISTELRLAETPNAVVAAADARAELSGRLAALETELRMDHPVGSRRLDVVEKTADGALAIATANATAIDILDKSLEDLTKAVVSATAAATQANQAVAAIGPQVEINRDENLKGWRFAAKVRREAESRHNATIDSLRRVRHAVRYGFVRTEEDDTVESRDAISELLGELPDLVPVRAKAKKAAKVVRSKDSGGGTAVIVTHP